MTLTPSRLPVGETTGTISGDFGIDRAKPDVAAGERLNLGLFERYVSVFQSNEYLFTELKSVDRKLASARAYLESPGSNPALARALLQQIRARRSAVLTLLRANRHQARVLLAGAESNVA